MLSDIQTQYLVKLWEKFQGKGFVIEEWTDLANLDDQNILTIDSLKEYWEQIRLNGLIIQKFKDTKQVGFSLADKANLLVQEYRLMQEHIADEEQTVMKTDSLGRTVVVIPKSQSDNQDLTKIKKIVQSNAKKQKPFKGFWSGLLGGLFGGLMSGGLVYYFLNIFVG